MTPDKSAIVGRSPAYRESTIRFSASNDLPETSSSTLETRFS
jgi:hypothetical protein